MTETEDWSEEKKEFDAWCEANAPSAKRAVRDFAFRAWCAALGRENSEPKTSDERAKLDVETAAAINREKEAARLVEEDEKEAKLEAARAEKEAELKSESEAAEEKARLRAELAEIKKGAREKAAAEARAAEEAELEALRTELAEAKAAEDEELDPPDPIDVTESGDSEGG